MNFHGCFATRLSKRFLGGFEVFQQVARGAPGGGCPENPGKHHLNPETRPFVPTIRGLYVGNSERTRIRLLRISAGRYRLFPLPQRADKRVALPSGAQGLGFRLVGCLAASPLSNRRRTTLGRGAANSVKPPLRSILRPPRQSAPAASTRASRTLRGFHAPQSEKAIGPR
jgi:hypothetical protein